MRHAVYFLIGFAFFIGLFSLAAAIGWIVEAHPNAGIWAFRAMVTIICCYFIGFCLVRVVKPYREDR